MCYKVNEWVQIMTVGLVEQQQQTAECGSVLLFCKSAFFIYQELLQDREGLCVSSAGASDSGPHM